MPFTVEELLRRKSNSAAVKSVTKASQWRKLGTRGRRKDRGALYLRIASFAGNSERQSLKPRTAAVVTVRLRNGVPSSCGAHPWMAGYLPEGRVKRADQLRAAPPSQTAQPRLLPSRVGRPGPDAIYPRGPDTRGDVLNLKILYWNPGGIIGKTRELRDLTQLEDAHIILLGETKLRPKQLRIPNFFAYRRDKISARGPAYRGTAVLILRDIMHEADQLMDFETMRSIGIRIGSSEQKIRLFAPYSPGYQDVFRTSTLSLAIKPPHS
ncbi:hypothetical protein EVAR_96488_1 [Eumeta japonica]|uniref:Uncharacterized protein n=1 Tax=Eumeta variegata TaxID=151549 RepID=A0A4C1ZUB6_EUMVA|nr:hypothetical protein EVAR_96488_1 [Eumeta japonica]